MDAILHLEPSDKCFFCVFTAIKYALVPPDVQNWKFSDSRSLGPIGIGAPAVSAHVPMYIRISRVKNASWISRTRNSSYCDSFVFHFKFVRFFDNLNVTCCVCSRINTEIETW